MSLQIARRHFNVADFYRMLEAGILTEDDRVELIGGEIVEMSPIGTRHSGCVMRLTTLLTEHVGRAAVVSVQNPVRVDDESEPEPDIAVLKPRADFYSDSHATPADVLLIVEVADTSLEYDRGVKVPLYARAGVAEVWLVDLVNDSVQVFAEPEAGNYKSARAAGRGQPVASRQLPALSLKADDILG